MLLSRFGAFSLYSALKIMKFLSAQTKRKLWNYFYNLLCTLVPQTSILLYRGSENDKFCNISSIAAYLTSHKIRFSQLSYDTFNEQKIRSIYKIARAKVLVLDASSPAARLRISRNTFLINCWHACGAYKKIAFDAKRKGCNEEVEEKRIARVHSSISYLICSSEYVADIYAKAFRMQKARVLALGIPRTDELVQQSACNDHCQHAPYPFTLLFAPTFRTQNDTRTLPSPPDAHALGTVLRELGYNDYVLAYRAHPTCSCTETNGWEDWSDLPLLDAMQRTSVLITDYSSIFFDFLFFKRPIIFYVPDLEIYQNTERELYFSPQSAFPESTCTDLNSLQRVLRSVCTHTSTKQEFFKKYMNSCDGHSTERVCKLILSLMKDAK